MCGMNDLTTFPKERPDSFPVKARKGTGAVTIYHKRRVKGGVQYDEFLIPFMDTIDGERQRRFHYYPSYETARAKGNEMLAQMASGEASAVTLNDEAKVVYNRAVEAAKVTGRPLDRIAADYARLWQRMGGDFFDEAADQFIARRDTLKAITVPDLVKLFIDQKTSSTKRGREGSADYVKDLNARLGQFETKFPGPVMSIKPDDILTYLDNLKTGKRHVTARTRFNHARLIGTLFRFAQSRRYFPKDVDPMEGIDVEFEDDGEIEIFKVAELKRILKAARADLVPFIAIGAFAGLRHGEIKRLDWQEIDLERGFIEVKGAKAKTRQRRLVPISANLKAWLEPHKKAAGRVVKFANCSKQIDWLVDDLNEAAPDGPEFKWKRNGLRHSFISYRLAQIQHADQVALEAGNSPQMIFKHYRELVRPDEAIEWFSIQPPAK